jgi:hypothetical protein
MNSGEASQSQEKNKTMSRNERMQDASLDEMEVYAS